MEQQFHCANKGEPIGSCTYVIFTPDSKVYVEWNDGNQRKEELTAWYALRAVETFFLNRYDIPDFDLHELIADLFIAISKSFPSTKAGQMAGLVGTIIDNENETVRAYYAYESVLRKCDEGSKTDDISIT